MFKIDKVDKIEISCSVVISQLGGAGINEKLDTLGEIIMTTKQQIIDAATSEAAEVKARIDELVAEVKKLKDQVATGGTVSEADLTDILTAVQNIFTPGGIITPPFPVPSTTDINGNIIDTATGNMVSSDGTVRRAAGTFTAEPDGSHKDMAGNTILTSSIP